ncbi:MAG: acyltransferase family protein [Acidobacteriota bacterium]
MASASAQGLPTERFRPDIEGLRAIAILAVVLWHAEVAGIPGGFTGVDIFFVLSGYLITGLLLREYAATSRISLMQFYARRARRLLPAALLMITVTLLVCALVLGPRELFAAGGSGRAAAVYLSNVWFAQDAADYFAQSGPVSPFVHTWSLAVEEQFYLVWPVMILLCLRFGKSRKALAWVLAALTLVSFAACFLLSYKNPQIAFYHSPFRAWQFGIGALAVMVPVDGPFFRRFSSFRAGIGWLGLAGILASVFYLDPKDYPGWRGLIPTISTALVLVSIPPRLLAARALGWLGGLSYSWYLWHWPMLTLVAAVVPRLSSAGKLAAVGAALIVAAATHRLIEDPVRFSKYLGARPALTLVMAIAFTAVTFGIGTAARWFSADLALDARLAPFVNAPLDNARPAPGCYTEASDSRVTTCPSGSVAGVRHIVLFGDSHAMQWFPAIEKVASARNWKLTPITKPGCPSTDARRDASSAEDICVAWRENAFEWIAANSPDLVIITNIYPTGEALGSHLEFTPIQVYENSVRSTLFCLTRTGASVMLIRDSPHEDFDIPNCLARSARTGWFLPEACRMTAAKALHSDFFEAERRASVGLPKVHLVDLSAEYCPDEYCDVQRGDLVLYRDHQHFTRSYALSLAPLIEPELGRILAP